MKLKGKSMRHRLRSGWKQQVRKGSCRRKELKRGPLGRQMCGEVC
jgi:hypothetical protein